MDNRRSEKLTSVFSSGELKKISVTKLIVPCNETGKSSKLSEELLLTMALALSSNKGGTLQTIGTHVMECSLKTKSLSETIKEYF